MPTSRGFKTTVLHLFVELFFAVLPLIVLGSLWPSHGQPHPESFWAGPELSMTSCILYGLTLARLLQGSVFAAGKSFKNKNNIHEVAASYSALSIIPVLGVIFSVIAISQSLSGNGGWKIIAAHVINLVIAVIVFFVLGGHGIKRSETEGDSSDSAE